MKRNAKTRPTTAANSPGLKMNDSL